MKRKETNEKIAEFIKQCADDLREELDRDVKIAETHVIRTETALLSTLTKEQQELFNECKEARERYNTALCVRYDINKKLI